MHGHTGYPGGGLWWSSVQQRERIPMAQIFLLLNSPFTFLDVLILENCFKMILKCQATIVLLQTASALFFLFTQLRRGKSSGSHHGRAGCPSMPWQRRLMLPLTGFHGCRSHKKWGMPQRMPCSFSWMAKPLPSPWDTASNHQAQSTSISKKDIHVSQISIHVS